jgi:hypothetical protein
VIDLNSIVGIDWDEGTQEKSWIKHHVVTSECEETFFNLPLLLETDPSHSQAGSCYFVLGQANSGLYLIIAFTLRSENIHVISARDMSKKERTIYEQANT